MLSRSQLLTPVVPIIKYQERTTKRNKDQINGQKVQDVKIAPPNGNKRAKISRCQERTTKRNKDQINGQKVQGVKNAPPNGTKIK